MLTAGHGGKHHERQIERRQPRASLPLSREPENEQRRRSMDGRDAVWRCGECDEVWDDRARKVREGGKGESGTTDRDGQVDGNGEKEIGNKRQQDAASLIRAAPQVGCPDSQYSARQQTIDDIQYELEPHMLIGNCAEIEAGLESEKPVQAINV